LDFKTQNGEHQILEPKICISLKHKSGRLVLEPKNPMLKNRTTNFQEPEFTAKTQNRSARFLELVKAQNRKTSSRTLKNSILKTEGQKFQNPKLKAQNRSTRF
jgi:hypothetical protein